MYYSYYSSVNDALLSGLEIMTSIKEQRRPEEMSPDSKEGQIIYSATETSCFLSSDLGFFF